jgi:excinuclease ABC subunit C
VHPQKDQTQAVWDTIRKRVAEAPTEPGVYRWLGNNGTILYVGKAKNLRNRLKSYLQKPDTKIQGPWKRLFHEQVTDFDVTVCTTELEALVLETNLIKQFKPKYNVLMKDDKNYVFVRITVKDHYPTVGLVRRVFDDGAKYFGPKMSAYDMQQTLSVLRKFFPFRTCKMGIAPVEAVIAPERSPRIVMDVVCTNKDRPTPCLDFHMKKCSAPCIGKRTPEEYYKESIEPVTRFLSGNHDEVKTLLQGRMLEAAKEKKFEEAAEMRNQLESLGEIQEKQLATDTELTDTDVIGVAVLSGRAHVVLLQRRRGKIVNERSFDLAGHAAGAAEVLEQFVPQYYSEELEVPGSIILPEEVPELGVLLEWLTTKAGRKVQIVVPERGKKSGLLELAQKNALHKARLQEAKWEADRRNTQGALEELQTLLGLESPPDRIEAYDISHLGGTETVGSMVVAVHGKPTNAQYRSFTLRTVERSEIDDYKAMKEVLQRRLKYLTLDLTKEERELGDQGLTCGKARKKEKQFIEGVIGGAINYKDFMVLRHEKEIVALARLHALGDITELADIWVTEPHRGTRIEHFLIRKLLRCLKKGKVYVTIDPARENEFGELGFRYVITPPEPLQKRIEAAPADARPIAMVYDAAQNKVDPSFSARPNLIVIDGGKGQLNAALEVLRATKLDIPAIGLAKREEEIFVPGQKDPVLFPKDSPAKFLLMRLRDEAHRFANRHREARGKQYAKSSLLDEVPGIGDVTRVKLLQKYGSLSALREASDVELREILTDAQLRSLRRHL